jgi:hypothetical protein
VEKVPRALLLALGGVGLLAGLDAALLLLGLPAPVVGERLPGVHGPVLVLGFVGTVVALERAVALRRGWGYLAPALLGLGGVTAVVDRVPAGLAPTLALGGAVALGAVYVGLWRRQPSDALAVQVLGAVAAIGAALLWRARVPVPVLVPWFTAFVVLTIVGERIELARLAISDAQARVAAVLAVGVLGATAAATLWPAPGHVLLGASLLVVVAWSVRHDVARRTAHATGLPRFVAWSLLAGYAWLAVAGAVWLLLGAASGPAYDAVAHAVFLGFTLAMIMAHAPIVLPAVLRRPLPYHPAMWAPVALLHGSLALRLVAGDAHGTTWALQTGGALNVAAVLGFLATAVWSATRRRRRAAPERAPEAPTPAVTG